MTNYEFENECHSDRSGRISKQHSFNKISELF